MGTAVSPYVRNEARDEDPSVLLTRPVTALLGVSDSAATGLTTLCIETVFDLAASSLFAHARQLLEAAELPQSALARVGVAPHDLIDDQSRAHPLRDLELESIEALREIGETTATSLRAALGVSTVRELALWPPYRAACEILSLALGGTSAVADDDERPLDLLPGTGRHPTERVQYEVLLLDKLLPASGLSVAPTALEGAGQIDVTSLETDDLGFTSPALGALLTFTQSWYTLGLSLGQLLHALALAPGESTRIAMVDWSRRTRATAGETIAETELLVSDLGRKRSIDEVTHAVAKEIQEGWSHGRAAAAAGSLGYGSGVAGSAPVGPAGLAAGTGLSLGLSGGLSDTRSWSSSGGNRDIKAEMGQYITDTTHQASNMTRNRWATAIREVSQQEHEELSTRSVTNYNHMHALTIQYYEVVQLYRTTVELARITRCVFIPMKLVDFNRPGVVDRHRSAIAAAGLNARVRLLAVAEPNALVVSAPHRAGPWSDVALSTMRAMFGEDVGEPTSEHLTVGLERQKPGLASFYVDPAAPFASVIFESLDGTVRELPLQKPTETPGNTRINMADLFPQLSPSQAAEAFLRVTRVKLRKASGTENVTGRFQIMLGLRLAEGQWADPNADLVLAYVSTLLGVEAGTEPVIAFELAHTLAGAELLAHLRGNRLHYSQAVWRSLEAATLAVIFSDYTIGGRPLLEVIDPMPVTIAGNYLVFRTYAEDNEWASFLKAKKLALGRVTESVVPLPSGGVFAEAVLGRSNAAEKLDLTRFWNWQDSPIPIAAPEIAALQAGSRAQPEPLEPGQLSQPVLNIVNPPALPDPQGLGAILAAIQNGNMFRDMSGLAATIGMAQAALTGAQQGATDAASQAGHNAAAAAQLAAAAYLAGAGGGGPAGSAGGISAQGARINQGRDMDRRGVPRPGVDGELPPFEEPGPVGGDGRSSLAGTWEGDAAEAGLGAGAGWSNVREMIARGILGAAPKGGGGLAGAGKAVGEKAAPAVLAGIAADARLKESWDLLVSEGWELRRTNIFFGNSSFDASDRAVYIDDDDEPVATTTEWAADAVRKVYQEDDDLRRRVIRDKAITIFNTANQTDLERMARTFDWAVWFWRYPKDNGHAPGLFDDMMLVLTDREPNVLTENDGTFFIFSSSRVPDADSTGFHHAFRDDSNQVRHATASIQASLRGGEPGYAVMQLRESMASADWRLNNRCFKIANGFKMFDTSFRPKDIAAILRRELGDPSETGPWTGPADGDPNATMP